MSELPNKRRKEWAPPTVPPPAKAWTARWEHETLARFLRWAQRHGPALGFGIAGAFIVVATVLIYAF